MAATGLKKSTDEKDFKELVCIFQEFKSRSGLNEFVSVALKIVFRDGIDIFVKLIAEDYKIKQVERSTTK